MPIENDPLGTQTYHYKPKWDKMVDYSPDHQESSSKYYTEKLAGTMRGMLQVKGIGVIVFHATPTNATIKNAGQLTMAIYTRDEIGFCPEL